MRFLAVSETVSVVKDRERCCFLIALIMRRDGEIICKAVISDQGSAISFRAGPTGRRDDFWMLTPDCASLHPGLFSRSPSGRHLATDHALPERFHAASVDGRIYESSRVTSEARPASYLQKTGGFYIAAGAHRFSQRSFLAEDGRSRFVVSPVPKSEGPGPP